MKGLSLAAICRQQSMMSVGKEEQAQEVAVVLVPFTLHSHLAQHLHLSLLLCSRPGLSVHYASSSTHIREVRARLNPAWSSSSASAVTFHELPLPAFSSPPPNPFPTTKFPAHLQPMFEAFAHLRAPVGALLRSLSASARRVVVLHDPLASFAAEEAAALPNAESYVFQCIPALILLLYYRPSIADELQTRGICLPSMEGTITEEVANFVRRRLWSETAPISGMLMNTSRTIEAEFIDLVAQEPANRTQKVFAIGPVSPLAVIHKSCRLRSPQEPCLRWLDKQPPASVVFVSFGTTTAISDEQIAEVAHGLLRSGQRFLWVLLDADRGDIYAPESAVARQIKLPAEFEAALLATEGGTVVPGWAPQLDILANAATGAFMSHCGWNSTIEAICMGVPVIAWPMHSDQPLNAVLVSDYLRTGVAVRKWTPGMELVGRAEVEAAVKRVMESGEEGRRIRERARALGEAVRGTMAEGGASRAELDAFVAQITRS